MLAFGALRVPPASPLPGPKVGLAQKDTDEPSWIKQYDSEQEAPQELYLSGFYLVAMTLT